MSKDTYWFRHDSNARNDVRLVKLRRVAGLEGVGLFWCLIEMLREAKNYELPLTAIDDIAYDLRVDESVFGAIFDSELLQKGDTFFYSISLLNRMSEYDKVKEKRRLAGAKGGKAKASKVVASASDIVASAKQDSSKSVAKVKQSLANRVELNRVEESRVDSNIIDNTKNTPNPSRGKRFVPPSLDDVKCYCLERRNSVDYQNFIDFYSSNGWKVGKNKMKDWKASVRTWERSNFNKPQEKNSRAAKEATQFTEPEINIKDLFV